MDATLHTIPFQPQSSSAPAPRTRRSPVSRAATASAASNAADSAVEGHALWEADPIFRCPLVGMCLSITEQRQLVKRADLNPEDFTPYALHELLVGAAASDNALARKINQCLRRKFEGVAAPLRAMAEEEFLHFWQSAFASGVYQAALWAAASRAELSFDARRAIYGDIHMAMHGLAEARTYSQDHLRRALRDVDKQRQTIKELKAERQPLLRELAKLRKAQEEKLENAALPAHDPQLELVREELASQAARIEALTGENNDLLAELDTSLEELDLRALEIHELRERCEAAESELDTLRRYVLSLQPSPEDCAQCMEAQGCTDDCPDFDVCRKRVLIVGGIERMETRYRQIVEKEGGILDYHDGNMQGGVKKLERCLQKADVVLCPVNCNSHGACIMVKKLGKKHNKPVHMMANFSLHAISSILGVGVAAGV